MLLLVLNEMVLVIVFALVSKDPIEHEQEQEQEQEHEHEHEHEHEQEHEQERQIQTFLPNCPIHFQFPTYVKSSHETHRSNLARRNNYPRSP